MNPSRGCRSWGAGRRGAWLAWLLLLAVPTACSRPALEKDRVVASVAPLASLLRLVTGDAVEVATFLPAGRDPHDFEPAPSQVQQLRRAFLVVSVGPGVDDWMDRAAKAEGNAPLLRMASLAAGASWTDPGGRLVADPHLWLDRDCSLAFVAAAAESLAARDPERASIYLANAGKAAVRLGAVDDDIRVAFQPVRNVPFALHHAIFLDWVRRFDLRLLAVLERHADGEASPRTLSDAAEALRDAEGDVVFSQPELDARLARTLADEVGGRVVELDPLGSTLVPADADFIAFLRWNAERMVEALRGAGS